MRAETPGMRDRLYDLWEARRQDRRVELALQTARRDMRSGGELLASALAMRLFILLLPFTAALLAAIGLVTNADAKSSEDALEGLGIASTAAQSVTGASRLSNGSLWIVLAGSLFALVLASKTMLRAIWTIHALAFNEAPSRPPRPWLGALIVVGCLLSMIVILLPAPTLRSAYGPVGGLLGVGLAFALATAFWLAVACVLPHGSAPWRVLIPGAVTTALGMVVLHAATTFWAIGIVSHYNAAYGALGTAVALLLWFYALGRLIVAGAMLNAARWELQGNR